MTRDIFLTHISMPTCTHGNWSTEIIWPPAHVCNFGIVPLVCAPGGRFPKPKKWGCFHGYQGHCFGVLHFRGKTFLKIGPTIFQQPHVVKFKFFRNNISMY